MATLVISGGVRENTLTGAASPANFASITLQNTNANPKLWTFPQGVIGLPGILQPVQFSFERFIRQTFVDDLAAISVHVFAAPPRSVRGGSVSDAVAQNSGAQLVKITYDVLDGSDESTSSENLWCVFQLSNVQRVGRRESGTMIVYPCNVLWLADTLSFYADPDTTF